MYIAQAITVGVILFIFFICPNSLVQQNIKYAANSMIAILDYNGIMHHEYATSVLDCCNVCQTLYHNWCKKLISDKWQINVDNAVHTLLNLCRTL
jgi:hypothetical protein